jgi:PPP family 3-phenylpropionic acid transporter
MEMGGFFLLYIFIYAANGILTPYSSLVFQSAGFGQWAIGILASIGPLVSLVCQPIWGIISDRARSKRTVLRLTLFMTAITVWLVAIGQGFWAVTCALIVFFMFQSAVLPLSDAITLESLEGTSFKFSPIRTAGSIGYAVVSALAGKAVGKDIFYFFPLYSATTLLAFFSSFKIPDVEGHQKGKERLFIREFLKDRELVRVYLFAFFLHITSGYNYAFLSVYLKELNMDMGLVGLGFMVASFSQYPFLFFADTLLERLGIQGLFIISGIFHALRWFLSFAFMGPGTILIIQALHGMTYIVLYYSLAHYVNKRVPKELKATGQMMNWAILNGLARIVGGTGGGFIAEAMGIRYGYLIAGVLACAVTLCYFLVSRKKGDSDVGFQA